MERFYSIAIERTCTVLRFPAGQDYRFQKKFVAAGKKSDLSIGKRILMRMGSKNEAKVKIGLREIRQELILHLHEQKAGTLRLIPSAEWVEPEVRGSIHRQSLRR